MVKKHSPCAREQLVELHQVRMAQAGQAAKFALELEDVLGVRAVQGLERDRTRQARVRRTIGDAHRPAAEQRLDEEAAAVERDLRGQRQRCSRQTSRAAARPASMCQGCSSRRVSRRRAITA